MATKKAEPTFEEAINQLELIVRELEHGDIPLEKALGSFKEGIGLSQFCQKKLADAEEMLTKIMNEEGQEVVFQESENVNA